MKFSFLQECQTLTQEHHKRYWEMIDEVELADKVGWHSYGLSEQHFTPKEYTTSAPEIFLASAAVRTKQIRIRHAVVTLLKNVNRPLKIAERVAMLDIMSNGRVDFGTGTLRRSLSDDGACRSRARCWQSSGVTGGAQCDRPTCTVLRKQPGVGNVADLAYPVKLSNSFIHGEDPAAFVIPATHSELGFEVLDVADHAPGAYLWLFTNDLTQTVVIAYGAGTDPVFVKHLMTVTQQKADELFAKLPVTVGVAGGSVGIAQAFNDNIGYWLVVGALLGFLGSAILAIPFIGSVRLALILTVPLIMGTIISLAVMHLLGIELNSNTIAALAIASGVGIDSEVYLLFRVREEYAKLHEFREALVQGYVKIRRALLVSNGALILGCWALTPVPLYIGYVGFGMGMVLFWCFLMSAVLSPLLWAWFGEEVLTGSSTEIAEELPLSSGTEG